MYPLIHLSNIKQGFNSVTVISSLAFKNGLVHTRYVHTVGEVEP